MMASIEAINCCKHHIYLALLSITLTIGRMRCPLPSPFLKSAGDIPELRALELSRKRCYRKGLSDGFLGGNTDYKTRMYRGCKGSGLTGWAYVEGVLTTADVALKAWRKPWHCSHEGGGGGGDFGGVPRNLNSLTKASQRVQGLK